MSHKQVKIEPETTVAHNKQENNQVGRWVRYSNTDSSIHIRNPSLTTPPVRTCMAGFLAKDLQAPF